MRVVLPEGELKTTLAGNVFPNLIVLIIKAPEQNVVTIDAHRVLMQEKVRSESVLLLYKIKSYLSGSQIDETQDGKGCRRTHELAPELFETLALLGVLEGMIRKALFKNDLILERDIEAL